MPGTQIIVRDAPPPRTAPTDTGPWFVAGLTEKGTAAAAQTPIRSLSDYVNRFGERVSYGLLYDALDAYFREGGSVAYVGRVLGPSAVKASVSLSDGTNPTLKVEAVSAGDWANSLNVQVVAGSGGGTFVIVVSDDTLGELERSPDLADTTAAIDWAASSDWVRASELSGTGDPVVAAAASLTSGTDDRANLTDASWASALALFPKALGPGQVSMPGRTTAQAHSDTLAHCVTNNRVALLDAPDVASTSALKTAAASVRGDANSGRELLLWPWAVVPGVLPNTTRTIPYSALEAGIIARNDAGGLSAADPAAGDLGQSLWAIDLSQDALSDDDRNDLNEAGVTVARVLLGVVTTYGYRTTADPATDPLKREFGSAREIMKIYAKADAIAAHYVLRKVDGKGLLFAQLNGDLAGMLKEEWEANAIYGDTPQEAYRVNTGSSVNTAESIAAGEIHAVIVVRPSPMGEDVTIEIVRTSITQEV